MILQATLQPRSRIACALAALLALAACGQDKKPDESRTAQGEVLPGSASDAMLPLDTVRSQPPLAPIAVASGKSGKGGAAGSAADEEAGGDAEAAAAETPAPAATPSIAADSSPAQ